MTGSLQKTFCIEGSLYIGLFCKEESFCTGVVVDIMASQIIIRVRFHRRIAIIVGRRISTWKARCFQEGQDACLQVRRLMKKRAAFSSYLRA